MLEEGILDKASYERGEGRKIGEAIAKSKSKKTKNQ